MLKREYDNLDNRLALFKQQLNSLDPTLRLFCPTTPIIGYDLDGVFYDFVESLRTYIHKSTGRPRETMPNNNTWEFWEEWDIDVDEWLDFCNKGADEGYIFTRVGHPVDSTVLGDVRSVRNLKSILKAEIVVITDRHFGANPEVSQKATTEWLDACRFPYDRLIFDADKTIYKTDFFIDDRPENCESLKKSGSHIIMMDRPWNKNHETDIPRTASITNFNTFILEKYKQAGARMSYFDVRS